VTSYESSLCAFGSGPLKGDNFVRWAYVDEAGISSREKLVTVAGVVINADKHHRAITARLNEMRNALPPELADGLIFHAKDIWHGNKEFEREKWEAHGIFKEERRSLVQKLCSIPAEFNLPVVLGFVVKEHHDWQPIVRSKGGNLDANRGSYAIAFGQCCITVEAFMRDRALPDEVAHIVAEDTKEMREYAAWSYELLERPFSWPDVFDKYLPIERIAEDPMFTPKKRSSILQVADSLAFVINRFITHYHVNKTTDSDVRGCWDAFASHIFYPWGLANIDRESPVFTV
jgi:hypothetical protein